MPFITAARKAAKAVAFPVGLLSGRRPGDIVILLYHRVEAGGREIDLPLAAFERQMGELVERERLLSLDQALDGGAAGGVVVTFDDGYGDFHRYVLPVLARFQLPAVLYLATGLVPDGRAARPEDLTWSQLHEAVSTGLVTIGAHTHRHADLSRASEDQAEREMRRSKELIEDRLGVACRHFAYPWAVGSVPADRVARRLFDSAALYAWRTNRRGRIDPHRLGRVPVLRGDGPLFFRAKARGRLNAEGLTYRLLRRGPWRAS